MSKTQYKSLIDRNKQSLKGLHIVAGVRDNTATTTKLLAVKPYRHTLAIFMPKIYGATNPIVTTGIKQRHIFKFSPLVGITSYGGLIRPNKIAFMANKSSRLVTVVETCHPLILGGKKNN